MLLHLLLVVGVAQCILADREHKVHNIVLYPERHSWCQTTPIKQVVAFPGYEPMTIDNNVCVGACYSYSIPRTQPAEPGELIGPYCDSCQPTEARCYHVTLKSDGNNGDEPKMVQKRVQIITNCTCKSCETIKDNKDCEVTDQSTSELPTDLFKVLLNITSNTPDNDPPLTAPTNSTTHTSHNDTDHLEPYTKLLQLLRSLQEDDTSAGVDYTKLKQLLQRIDGSGRQVSDAFLTKFVNYINVHGAEETTTDVDVARLKAVLADMRSQELAERHRTFGLGMRGDGGDHLTRLLGLARKNALERAHLGRLERNEVGGGVRGNSLDEGEEEEHHHVGEAQHVGVEEGHLVAGPHGSLVFAADAHAHVEEKLSLEPHMVKPNHEGVVVAYENHPQQQQQQQQRHHTLFD